MLGFGIAFSPLVPDAVLWAAVAVAGAIVILLFVGRTRGAAVRALALALMVAALANPSLTREDRDPLTSVAVVVVDKSPSQDFGERTAQTAAARAALVTRLQRVPGLELRVVEAGQADGETDGTRLFQPLAATLSDVPPERVAGAFMITDGRVHDVPAEVGALGCAPPLHALTPGTPDELDRRVVLVAAPRFGIVGQQQTVSFRVEDTGAPAGRAQGKISRGGETLDQRTVTTGQTVEVQIAIPHAGPNIVEIEASPLERELTTVNNRAVVSIDGVRDKLRVLLVSGEPHSGERTWRNLLKSDANVDLVHFTILRPPEKQDGTPINELSLIAFPTRELFQQKINEFQLIIFDRYARQGVLPIIYFDNIARYVRQGGAVLVAAGPDYATPTSIWRTPLDVILPAEPSGRMADGAFRAQLTDLGKRHPVTRGLEGSDSDPPHCAAGPRGPGSRPAALEPLVSPRRQPRCQGYGSDARSRQQAAAAVVTGRRRPRRAPSFRPHLAVGTRLRGRRPAYRFVTAVVALADEAARFGGRSTSADGGRGRPHPAAPDHVRHRERGDAHDAVGQDPHLDPFGRRARRLAHDDRSERAWALARHRRYAQCPGQCGPGQSA